MLEVGRTGVSGIWGRRGAGVCEILGERRDFGGWGFRGRGFGAEEGPRGQEWVGAMENKPGPGDGEETGGEGGGEAREGPGQSRGRVPEERRQPGPTAGEVGPGEGKNGEKAGQSRGIQAGKRERRRQGRYSRLWNAPCGPRSGRGQREAAATASGARGSRWKKGCDGTGARDGGKKLRDPPPQWRGDGGCPSLRTPKMSPSPPEPPEPPGRLGHPSNPNPRVSLSLSAPFCALPLSRAGLFRPRIPNKSVPAGNEGAGSCGGQGNGPGRRRQRGLAASCRPSGI